MERWDGEMGDEFWRVAAPALKCLEQVPHWKAGISIEETILGRTPGLFPLPRIVSSIETPVFQFKLFELRKQYKRQETIQQDWTHKATINKGGANCDHGIQFPLFKHCKITSYIQMDHLKCKKKNKIWALEEWSLWWGKRMQCTRLGKTKRHKRHEHYLWGGVVHMPEACGVENRERSGGQRELSVQWGKELNSH